MEYKAKNITRTAVLLALLIILQTVTRPLGQMVTGSCVNAVLAEGALLLPLPLSLLLAVVSPFLAMLLGIGPQLLPVTAAICLANAAFCAVISLLFRKKENYFYKLITGAAASVLKFAVLYFTVVKLLCTVLTLPEKQTAVFTAMFSYPQLVTALIGSTVAFAIVSVLKKALR